MKKLLLTLLAVAAVSGAFARRSYRGGRYRGGQCSPCKVSKCDPCGPSRCAEPRCPMPDPPAGGCLPQAQCSDQCTQFRQVVPCEAWAVVEAKQPVIGTTNVTTTTSYAFEGCPFVDDECLSRDKIRLGDGVYRD